VCSHAAAVKTALWSTFGTSLCCAVRSALDATHVQAVVTADQSAHRETVRTAIDGPYPATQQAAQFPAVGGAFSTAERATVYSADVEAVWPTDGSAFRPTLSAAHNRPEQSAQSATIFAAQCATFATTLRATL
jgi:hypothetical protein